MKPIRENISVSQRPTKNMLFDLALSERGQYPQLSGPKGEGFGFPNPKPG